jgi:hypothetical protein
MKGRIFISLCPLPAGWPLKTPFTEGHRSQCCLHSEDKSPSLYPSGVDTITCMSPSPGCCTIPCRFVSIIPAHTFTNSAIPLSFPQLSSVTILSVSC